MEISVRTVHLPLSAFLYSLPQSIVDKNVLTYGEKSHFAVYRLCLLNVWIPILYKNIK